MNQSIVALNGFMGLPSDWDILNLGAALKPWTLSNSSVGMDMWSTQLNEYAAVQASKPIIMGYSFGGRVALHAITLMPSLWEAAIIVSAHPGLDNELDKQKRLSEDTQWVEKILNDPWDVFIQDWNARKVFGAGHSFDRKEEDYDRKDLAQQLIQGSPGKQGCQLHKIACLPTRILWIVGANDTKYCSLADKLSFSNPDSKVLKVPGAGHRVLWDQHEFCRASILTFTDKKS